MWDGIKFDVRPDGVGFLIEGNQNVPDEKSESGDLRGWGQCQSRGCQIV
jgi:hypothetical protein